MLSRKTAVLGDRLNKCNFGPIRQSFKVESPTALKNSFSVQHQMSAERWVAGSQSSVLAHMWHLKYYTRHTLTWQPLGEQLTGEKLLLSVLPQMSSFVLGVSSSILCVAHFHPPALFPQTAQAQLLMAPSARGTLLLANTSSSQYHLLLWFGGLIPGSS